MVMRTDQTRTFYACNSCGAVFARWQGQCPECGQWDTLHEEKETGGRSGGRPRKGKAPAATPLSQVPADGHGVIPTGIAEFDIVLGGGAIPGATVLIGGEPGIGKSTLLLQLAGALAQRNVGILYVTGEESAAQIRRRADRLGIRSEFHLLAETDLSAILAGAEALRPSIGALVIDSIQTTSDRQFQSPPGTVSQVRECAAAIGDWARAHAAVAFLVGHVTKDGFIAGPKVLEHLVDTVLQFEGDRRQWMRILRCLKNRYGFTHEVGLFEMTETGLSQVTDPAARFLTGYPEGACPPGTAVTVVIEGRRPLLLEVQALVGPMVANVPQRVVSGFDPRRAAIIVAVLQNVAGLSLAGRDIYMSIAGGYMTDEPAVDLAAAVAIASSALKRPVSPRAVFIGEIGLSGEMRAVPQLQRRLAEAGKIGFQTAVVPAVSGPDNSDHGRLELRWIRHVADALKMI